MAAKKGGWIARAIKKPGAFRAQAKRAKMGTAAYATHVLKPGSKASTKTKQRARLAKTLMGMKKRGKKK